MKKTEIIKKNYEFRYFFKKGEYVSGKLLEIFIFENKLDKNKIGIIVSRKVGKSVVRNKIKRYIRAAYAEIEDKLIKNYNILLIWKKKTDVERANFFDIKKDMICILKNAKALDED